MYFTSWYLKELSLNPFLEDISTFVGPLTPLFLTSGDVCPGFQSQGGSPHLHVSSPVHNGTLRFTYGVTAVDLLAANSHSHPRTCKQALVGGSRSVLGGTFVRVQHIDYLDRKLPGLLDGFVLNGISYSTLCQLINMIELLQDHNTPALITHRFKLLKCCNTSKPYRT